MKRQEALKIIDSSVETLASQLEQGLSDPFRAYLDFMARFHRYSFRNQILILCQMPEASHVAGFHAWLKLDRCVRRGEHGCAILAPMIRTKKDEQAGQEPSDRDSRRFLSGFKIAYVFDISQTEGKELPQFTTVKGEAGLLLEQLKVLVKQLGITLEFESLGLGIQGASAGGQIYLRPGMAIKSYADLAYAAAFQDYGIDVVSLDPYAAAEKIQRSVICDELVATLDDWAFVKRRVNKAEWERLQVVVKLADADAWRNRFRDASIKKDRKALEELANQPKVSALPPSTVVLLSRALGFSGSKGNAAALLSAVQGRHPSDFWLNTELATVMAKLNQPQEALGYFRAALAIRPQSAGTCVGLGYVLAENPENLDKAIAAFREAVNLKRDYAAAYRGLGHAHGKKGDHDEAIAAFRKAIEHNPTSVAIHLDLYHELIQQGQIEAAYTLLKGAQERGSKSPQWPKIAGLNLTLAIAHRLVESDRKLPAILRGEAKPENVNDCLGLGKVCYYKQLDGASASFYAEAFRTKPERQAGNLYAAACAAARAGCGKSKDDPPLDEPARTRWRKQALDWLRIDLAALTKQVESNSAKVQARAALQKWQRAPDFAGLRNMDQLARFPRPEQESWLRLWLDVEALLDQVQKKNP